MEISIIRRYKKEQYTIGDLYIDNQWICNTLEDKDRGLTQSMSLSDIKKIKIKNETAIPSGTYTLTMNVVSPKFKNRVWAKPYNGKVPRILNVPGFDGILLHPGSTQADTSGCVCVGENKVKGKLINSQSTFHKLMSKLKDISTCTIIIK